MIDSSSCTLYSTHGNDADTYYELFTHGSSATILIDYSEESYQTHVKDYTNHTYN